MSAGSIFFACVYLSHTGHAYSADEYESARAVDYNVYPQVVPVSLLRILSFEHTLLFVFSTWVLNEIAVKGDSHVYWVLTMLRSSA